MARRARVFSGTSTRWRRPSPRADDVSGRLFEANFERRSAILRTATSDTVEVSFSEDQEEIIQTALPQTSTEIVQGVEQLTLDPGDFWRELSLDELAERQAASALAGLPPRATSIPTAWPSFAPTSTGSGPAPRL
jgi:hypothetical protein